MQVQSASSADDVLILQQKLARVQALLETSRQVHSTIRLEEVLAMTLEIAVKELEVEGVFFQSNGQLGLRSHHLRGSVPDDWTQSADWGAIPGYTSVALAGEQGETIAHLVTWRRTPFSFEETDFLEGLGLQAALAVRNAQHHERVIEWERVRMDMEAARMIQRSLLPQEVPDVGGYSLSLRSTACYEVGGDYVDVMPLQDGTLMMVVADVAGKGLASAMISMTFRSSFRAIAGSGLSLEDMAARLNALHWGEGPEARRRYVTAVLLSLDPHSHTLQILSAGHNPAFLRRGHERLKIGASGPPLGMMPGLAWEQETHHFPPGAQLLVYTDGLTEVFQGDEEFGEDRLFSLLGDQPREDQLDFVWTTLAGFAGNARQTDDMTALYISRVFLKEDNE